MSPSNTTTAMYTIAQTNPRSLTPNILPCQIHHNGPVGITKRYWNPQPASDKTNKSRTAYFRGRKLQSRTLQLPEGYQGVLLRKTDQLAPREAGNKLPQVPIEQEEEDDDDDDELDDDSEDVKVMEQMGKFHEVVVWGHEAVPEDGDEYVKGIEEWMAFAHAMHDNET
ncbi:hypothetical protein LTR78_002179 [Recurvomyces mirabilis]|uniref:Uncharacterized protein n=1 Tax=Recurvomyces mirabilis TaxID=574656 RepID=A0AAE0WUY5_9PEZI|nr:hypothetical protein LTR78_002179 [Recurvomyces mirabilis]KAK5160636.1 hypothetical protein LTS14_001648 [Recurvomyces mirabilis]